MTWASRGGAAHSGAGRGGTRQDGSSVLGCKDRRYVVSTKMGDIYFQESLNIKRVLRS